MQDYQVVLIAVTLIQVYIYELPEMLGRELIPYKPFNCSRCLSFWVGLLLAILFLNPIFVLIFLVNLIVEYFRL